MTVFDSLFHPDGYWTTKDGRRMKIEDIGPYHARNICNLLERRAAFFQTIVYWDMACFALSLQGEMAIEQMDREMDRLIEQNPVEWIKSTPLYQLIEKRATDSDLLLKIHNKSYGVIHF